MSRSNSRGFLLQVILSFVVAPIAIVYALASATRDEATGTPSPENQNLPFFTINTKNSAPTPFDLYIESSRGGINRINSNYSELLEKNRRVREAGSKGLGSAIANGPEHDGSEVATDLPDPLRVKNTVGTDGQGLCVWASTEMMARYLNVRGLVGIFEAMQREPGGGWPERVDREMAKRCPTVKYRQYLGGDISFIRQAIDSGRPVCATYGYGEFYGSRTIAHMVLIVAMDDRQTGVLDNNDPSHIWWMPTEEYARRFSWPSGQGWAWYALASPPPPPPRN